MKQTCNRCRGMIGECRHEEDGYKTPFRTEADTLSNKTNEPKRTSGARPSNKLPNKEEEELKNLFKEWIDFPIAVAKIDGHTYACRECYRKNHAKYYKEHKEKWIEKSAKSMIKNAHKWKARSLVRSAVKSGKLIKTPCEICGEREVQGHHSDYGQPLKVNWLCKEHHLQVHRRENPINLEEPKS